MTEDDAIEFYEAYLAAWNAQDLTALTGFYYEPGLFVQPGHTLVLGDLDETLGALERVFEKLREDDFGKSTYKSLEVKDCAEGLAVLDVAGIKRWRRDGSLMEEVDCHYVLRHEPEGGWRIAVVVVCRAGWRQG